MKWMWMSELWSDSFSPSKEETPLMMMKAMVMGGGDWMNR